jgi:competence protein ComEC
VLEPGFQLSFAAVAGIFMAVPWVRRRLEGYPLPRRLGEVITVALVCGLVTAPIVLADFGVAPVYTVPANALAEPAMPLVLGLGLLAAVADPLSPGAAASLAWLAGWAAAWLDLVARLFAALPGAQIRPRGAVVVLVCVLLAGTAWRLLRGSRLRS